MASDLIESAVHEGGETRSRIDPGRGVSEAGSRGWRASERAGSAGQAPQEGPPATSSEGAEWLVGGRAARLAA